MSAQRKAKVALRPFPQAGDFVLIGHGVWSEPDNWWISRCEWSDGQNFLCRMTQGWHPSHDPYMGAADAIIAIGTREQCEAISAAARTIRFKHIDAFRRASVALQEVKDTCVAEIIEAVGSLEGGVQAAGRIS